MATEELNFFNVKNTSLRLIHVGGVTIPPEKVVAVIDDSNGINRTSIEEYDFLNETDEDANWPPATEEEKPVVKASPKKAAAKTETKTATGAGWNKQ